MEGKQIIASITLFAIFIAGSIFTGIYFFPWQQFNWGTVDVSPAKTVVVTGTAETKEKNQIARFTAGVSSVNDNKDIAINEVSQKIEAIINALTASGISKEDIKTQNLNVNRGEESYYEDGRQKSRPGQWRVNNTIEIKLYDVDRASDLASLLTQSGATNIYGPNFSMDDTGNAENSLLSDAIKNAEEKAKIIARASGKKLGSVISVTEGSQPVSVFRSFEAGGMGGGGGPIEPGSATIRKTVTVTFELR